MDGETCSCGSPSPSMVSVDGALRTVLSVAPRLQPATVPLQEALGLVLAEDVVARDPLPPFRASVMVPNLTHFPKCLSADDPLAQFHFFFFSSVLAGICFMCKTILSGNFVCPLFSIKFGWWVVIFSERKKPRIFIVVKVHDICHYLTVLKNGFKSCSSQSQNPLGIG